MEPRIVDVIKSTEATDQRPAYRVLIDTATLDTSDLHRAYREARIDSFLLIDRHVGERRPWVTTQFLSPGRAFIITQFEPFPLDAQLPRIPSKGR